MVCADLSVHAKHCYTMSKAPFKTQDGLPRTLLSINRGEMLKFFVYMEDHSAPFLLEPL